MKRILGRGRSSSSPDHQHHHAAPVFIRTPRRSKSRDASLRAKGSYGHVPLMAPASPQNSDESSALSTTSRSIDSGVAVMEASPVRVSSAANNNTRKEGLPEPPAELPPPPNAPTEDEIPVKKKRSFLDLVRKRTSSFRFRKQGSFRSVNDEDSLVLTATVPAVTTTTPDNTTTTSQVDPPPGSPGPERQVLITVNDGSGSDSSSGEHVDPAYRANRRSTKALSQPRSVRPKKKDSPMAATFLYDSSDDDDTTSSESFTTGASFRTGGTGLTSEYTYGTGYTSTYTGGSGSTTTSTTSTPPRVRRRAQKEKPLNDTMEDLRAAVEDLASDGRACWACVMTTSRDVSCDDDTTKM